MGTQLSICDGVCQDTLKQTEIYTILLVGPQASGKTTLIQKLARNLLQLTNYPTKKIQSYHVHYRDVRLTLIDTPGNMVLFNDSLTKDILKMTDAILYCYSDSDQQQLNQYHLCIQNLMDQVDSPISTFSLQTDHYIGNHKCQTNDSISSETTIQNNLNVDSVFKHIISHLQNSQIFHEEQLTVKLNLCCHQNKKETKIHKNQQNQVILDFLHSITGQRVNNLN